MKAATINRSSTSLLDNNFKPKFKTDEYIYLDNHATTPLDPRVLEAMLPYLREDFGNPASSHIFGIKAQSAVDKAREQVSLSLNAKPEEIIFTSGATESNNLVLKGVFEYFQDKKPHIIVSSIEHKCILEAAKHLKKLGAELTVLKVKADGLIDPKELDKAIKGNTVLVSIMLANNEIGSINDVKKLAKICHDKGALFHTDAAQAVGKMHLNVKDLDIDFLSASGHKFYGPKGIGFLYAKKSSQKFLVPLLDGGGQEAKLRSGTLNVPAIVGLGQAIELVNDNLEDEIEHYLELRNLLYSRFLKAFPDLILNGPEILPDSSSRLPNNLNITLPSIRPEDLDKVSTVAFSSTSACSSGEVEPSYVLIGVGRTVDEAATSLRFGVGRFNSANEVNQAADIIIDTLRV